MSSYDEQREQNIARNNKVLESLGFSTCPVELPTPDASASARTRTRKKTARDREPLAGTRSSKRLKVDPLSAQVDASPQRMGRSAVKASAAPVRSEILSHPALRHFENEPPLKRSATFWDLKKKHQHLQVSSSKRTVATTGCAGYGAVLAASDHGAVVSKSPNKSKLAEWAVQVIAEGIGGFSVGVCVAALPGPFKSLGNRSDSWVFHSSGTILHDRKSFAVKGCENGYTAGDTIHIDLSSNGELSFRVNDFKSTTKISLPPGKYILCCQPYMGGVGRIV